MFFFEKKNQKTFGLGAWAVALALARERKSFAELFFQKSDRLLDGKLITPADARIAV